MVQDIYRLLVKDRASCRAIARRLTEVGIPTPLGKGIWHPRVVNHMLRQELYYGVMYFNRHEPVKPHQRRETTSTAKALKTSRKLRPPEEWIAIPVPAIIDRATWVLAQKQLQANAHFSPRNNTRHTYLMRQLVRCGACGKSYSGVTINTRNREYQYYVCNQRYPIPGGDRRPARPVPLRLLEDVVWGVVTELLHDPETLVQEFRSRMAAPDNSETDREGQRLEQTLKRLEDTEDRFLDLYGDHRIDRQKLDGKLEQIGSQRKLVNEQRQAIDQQAQEAEKQIGLLNNLQGVL